MASTGVIQMPSPTHAIRRFVCFGAEEQEERGTLEETAPKIMYGSLGVVTQHLVEKGRRALGHIARGHHARSPSFGENRQQSRGPQASCSAAS